MQPDGAAVSSHFQHQRVNEVSPNRPEKITKNFVTIKPWTPISHEESDYVEQLRNTARNAESKLY